MTEPLNIDNSELGSALLAQIRAKQDFDAGESAYKKQLLNKVIQYHANKRENLQRVLDSAYFNGLSLSEKIQFINDHKDELSTPPKFKWGKVFTTAAESSGWAGAGTLFHQLGAHSVAGNVGKIPFKVNKWAMGGAMGLGGLLGGYLAYRAENQNYQRDVATQRRIGDAIDVLVNRTNMPAATSVDYVQKALKAMEDIPTTYGVKLSPIDFAELERRGAERMATQSGQTKQ